MNYERRKHNAPISTIIKRYLDKGRGKVQSARMEIKRRFYALDWRYQKKILFAFLQSGKTDRNWAYGQLFYVWDDCFIPTLQKLWEQYHEQNLSQLIIRFFPLDYLEKEFESLSKGRNYYLLYERLSDERDFALDRTRLSEADLLSVKYKLGETVINGDVRDLFFLLIYKLCKGVYRFRVECYNYKSHPLLCIFNSDIVNDMMRVLEYELGMRCMIEEIEEWMIRVTYSFTKEHGDLNTYYYSNRKVIIREKMKEHCLKHIAPAYKYVWYGLDLSNKQAFLDDLDHRHKERVVREYNDLANRSISKLVDLFDGEIVDTNPLCNNLTCTCRSCKIWRYRYS